MLGAHLRFSKSCVNRFWPFRCLILRCYSNPPEDLRYDLLPQSDLPKDAGILPAAAQHNRANVRVYASVLQGGKIRRGDSVGLE